MLKGGVFLQLLAELLQSVLQLAGALLCGIERFQTFQRMLGRMAAYLEDGIEFHQLFADACSLFTGDGRELGCVYRHFFSIDGQVAGDAVVQ